MENKIQLIKEAIEEVRPFLQQDGGDIEFVKLEDGVVYVNMRGACASCSSMDVTLKAGVESFMRDRFDFVTEVKQATAEDIWKDFM